MTENVPKLMSDIKPNIQDSENTNQDKFLKNLGLSYLNFRKKI